MRLHKKWLLTLCAAMVCSVVLSLDPALYASDEGEEVEASFKRFNQQWMDRLYAMEKNGRENLSCRKVKDSFIAEYTCYSRTYSARTKPTGSRETPYIGVLTYQEQKFISQASTYEGAINGKFILFNEFPVTQIFSFSDGTWQY